MYVFNVLIIGSSSKTNQPVSSALKPSATNLGTYCVKYIMCSWCIWLLKLVSGTSGGTGVQLHYIVVAIIIGMLIGIILTALACCCYFKRRRILSKIIMLHAHYYVASTHRLLGLEQESVSSSKLIFVCKIYNVRLQPL